MNKQPQLHKPQSVLCIEEVMPRREEMESKLR